MSRSLSCLVGSPQKFQQTILSLWYSFICLFQFVLLTCLEVTGKNPRILTVKPWTVLESFLRLWIQFTIILSSVFSRFVGKFSDNFFVSLIFQLLYWFNFFVIVFGKARKTSWRSNVFPSNGPDSILTLWNKTSVAFSSIFGCLVEEIFTDIFISLIVQFVSPTCSEVTKKFPRSQL